LASLEGASKYRLESHLEAVLTPKTHVWRSYKERLLRTVRNHSGLDIEEGQGCVRVASGPHPTLICLYRLADLIPKVEQRLLQPYLGSILQKSVCFLPSFWLRGDAFVTTVHWGRELLFRPEFLDRIRIENLMVEGPDHGVQYSMANLLWPRSIERHSTLSEPLASILGAYVFNALSPPVYGSDGTYDPWVNTPYVVLGNDSVRLESIHKTIYTEDATHDNESDVTILDRNLKARQVISRINGAPNRERAAHECLMTVHLDIRRGGVQGPTYSIFPLNVAKILQMEESPGVLITALSILLRKRYLESDHSLLVGLNVDQLADSLTSTLRSFGSSIPDELAFQFLSGAKGTSVLLNLLKVYFNSNRGLAYIHPELIESYCALCGEMPSKLNFSYIQTLAEQALQLLDQEKVRFSQELSLGSILRQLGCRDLHSATKFLILSNQLKSSIAPLTRLIHGYYEN
jgi:hypothetical protein